MRILFCYLTTCASAVILAVAPLGTAQSAEIPATTQPVLTTQAPQPDAEQSLSRRRITDADLSTGRAGGKLGADWRYVFARGRHWYWTRRGQWLVWHEGAWQKYQPGMFTTANTNANANGTEQHTAGYRGIPAEANRSRTAAPMFNGPTSPGPAMPNEHFMGH